MYKRQDGSRKKGKKKGLRFGKMSMDFDDLEEELGCCYADRNETELVGPAANDTEQSVLESVIGFGWTDEDMEIRVKYGLSPAYLREMRKRKMGPGRKLMMQAVGGRRGRRRGCDLARCQLTSMT